MINRLLRNAGLEKRLKSAKIIKYNLDLGGRTVVGVQDEN